MGELLDKLPGNERTKQVRYRDARFTDSYDDIWKSVGKCVFCDLREKYIFYEENGIVMTVSLYAYIDGHLMIIPRRHVRSVKELTELEWATIRKFTYLAKKLIRQVHGVRGMQLVEKDGSDAQSTVNQHLHFHAIPFDDPNLSTWNYRQLAYSPLESAQLYRRAGKALLRQNDKFNAEYRRPSTIRVIVDALIINGHNEILFQQRPEGMKLDPDWLSIPGGSVHNFDSTLEQELLREIAEECGIDFDPSEPRLIASRLSQLKYQHTEPHLKAQVVTPHPFMWNSYLIRTRLKPDAFTPGDDCEAIEWIPRAKVAQHPQISPEVKALIARLP
jgi:histidine triad (HIT) family protein